MAETTAKIKGGVKVFGAHTKGAEKVVAKLQEEAPKFSHLAAKITKPPARFHEMQVGKDDANYIITNYVLLPDLSYYLRRYA